MTKATEQVCFCAFSRDADSAGKERKCSAVATPSFKSLDVAVMRGGSALLSQDVGSTSWSFQLLPENVGTSSPMDAFCLQARLRRDLSGMEQVLVLLDPRAGAMPADTQTAGNLRTHAEITWATLCQTDCLSAGDLCVALSSGFDRVYLQLSADITRLNGQLQRVEAASARLRPGQAVRLFHSVDGLLGGWAEPPAHTGAPRHPGTVRKAELAISGTDCSYCGQCAWVCPTGALYHGDGVLSVEDAACLACGVCVAACPTRALRLVDQDIETTPETAS